MLDKEKLKSALGAMKRTAEVIELAFGTFERDKTKLIADARAVVDAIDVLIKDLS